MRRLLSLIFLLASCSTTPSQEAPIEREALKLQIANIEGSLDSARLNALSGDVAEQLISLADDLQEKAFYRRRALAALRFYPEDRVYQFLSKKISEPSNDRVKLLAEASSSMVTAFGQSRPEEVTALLAPLLFDEGVVLKEHAARSLLQLSFDKATALVSDAAAHDEDIRLVWEARP